MTRKKEVDIAQRIARALRRKSEPKPSAGCSKKSRDSEVIGSVPEHLRHLHNLLAELQAEMIEAECAFDVSKNRLKAVREIFFDSIKTQVPQARSCDGVSISDNWDVVAHHGCPDDDDDEMGGGLEVLMAALARR